MVQSSEFRHPLRITTKSCMVLGNYFAVWIIKLINYSCIPNRVEGKGKAVITDVIYSNKVAEVQQPSPAGSKEEQNAVKVSCACAVLCPVIICKVFRRKMSR